MSSIRQPSISRPDASLHDYNKITATTRAQDGSATVSGMSIPVVSADRVIAAKEFDVQGRTYSLGTIINGSAPNPPIKFESGAGMCSAIIAGAPKIIFTSNGNAVAAVGGSGLSVAAISSPSGVIDFTGSTITGVSGIAMKSGVYSISGDPVIAVGATPAVILSLPTDMTGTSASINACVWNFSLRVLFAVSGTSGAESGSESFIVRASIARDSGATPTMTSKHHIISSRSALAANVQIATRAVAGAVEILGVGIAGREIVWQADAEVLKVNTQ